jgi:hypothetical protein
MRRIVTTALIGAAVSGCGATEREGQVGDTLDGREVAATLLAFRPDVPAPKGGDVTGFSSPGAGNRFAAARVSLCSENGQAIRAFDFVLEHDGGEAHNKQPQSVFDDDFEGVREGCERGWLVYAIPEDATAQALTFAFDDTGSARPGDRENHLRFRWTLG